MYDCIIAKKKKINFNFDDLLNFIASGSSHTEITRSTVTDSTIKTGRGNFKASYGKTLLAYSEYFCVGA